MSDDRAGALAGRRIVVGVSGSIAAYKAISLVRLLTERDAVVDVAMTAAATRFVGPLTFASLTHRPVLDDVFELDADQQIAHMELAEPADAIVLAPATANLIGELAAGLVLGEERGGEALGGDAGVVGGHAVLVLERLEHGVDGGDVGVVLERALRLRGLDELRILRRYGGEQKGYK